MDISLIVPVYNSEKTLRKCILSIINSDFDRKFEIIVVNDGSTDRSLETIKDLFVKILNQENKGAAAARNLGVKTAKSRIIVFVDSDVVFFKDTLRKIYDRMKQKDAALLNVRYSRKSINAGTIARYKALSDYFYSYIALYDKKERSGLIEGVVLPGGCEAYDKKIFLELGGFDESITGADVERESMYVKLQKRYRLIADGNILTRHHFPGFKGVVKAYFYRTIHSIGLMHGRGYNQPYLKKNAYRVALGALVVPSVMLSLGLVRFGFGLYTIAPLSVLYIYILTHLPLFNVALKEYGFRFMISTFILNLFFCTLISFAGVLGTIKYKVLHL